MNNAEILAQSLGVDMERLLAFTFAHACLSAAWYPEDRHDPCLALRIAAIVEPHLASRDKISTAP